MENAEVKPGEPAFAGVISVYAPISSALVIPFDGDLPRLVAREENSLPGWGFRVGKGGGCNGNGGVVGLCGWVGPEGDASPPDSALQLMEPAPEEALFAFLLACGLSAVESAGLEMGDTAVVSGCGSLGQSILAAAFLQGARCIRVAPQGGGGELFQYPGRESCTPVLTPEELKAANPPSQRLVIWETTGESETLDLLVPRLGPRGKLILCRGDKSSAVQLDCYRDLHKTSALVESWKPGSPGPLSSIADCYRRAARLIEHQRVSKGRAWETPR